GPRSQKPKQSKLHTQALPHRSSRGHGHGILPPCRGGVSGCRRSLLEPAARGRPRHRAPWATRGRVQALRRLRRRRNGRRQGALLLVLRGRAGAGEEAPHAVAQRRARVLVHRLRRGPGAGPVPGQGLRREPHPQRLRVEQSREPAVPGGAGGRGVLLHQQDGGPGPPRRPRDGAGLVHLPPQLARQVPGVQGPRLLHRRRELRRALRPAARRSHLRGEQSGGQRQHHQPQRLHDWQRGAERRDGPAGHGGVRVEPRHHLRRAALGGDAGVRLLQGGGRRRQAREGLLVGRPRLHGRLRRHRHLQHLHADVPLPLRRLRLRRAALVQARHRAPPLLPARTTSYSLSLSDISGSAYTVCEKENKCLVVAVVRTQEAWHMMRRAPAGYDPCTEAYVTRYFNRQDVQRALHANRTGLKYPYSPCRLVLVP
uniref:Uncharacterized protein n=1 Tax=Aegilops tauschii subsp. strangulata TaxID=200361 RepID=A0A453CGQ9_AEGTS